MTEHDAKQGSCAFQLLAEPLTQWASSLGGLCGRATQQQHFFLGGLLPMASGRQLRNFKPSRHPARVHAACRRRSLHMARRKHWVRLLRLHPRCSHPLRAMQARSCSLICYLGAKPAQQIRVHHSLKRSGIPKSAHSTQSLCCCSADMHAALQSCTAQALLEACSSPHVPGQVHLSALAAEDVHSVLTQPSAPSRLTRGVGQVAGGLQCGVSQVPGHRRSGEALLGAGAPRWGVAGLCSGCRWLPVGLV